MTDDRVVETTSAAGTEMVGATFAGILRPGDRVFLVADLGGGKTTWTRGLVRGLGHPDPREVASPTYALHHRYDGGRLPVDHLDLYRLNGSTEALAREGVLDPFEDEDAVLVCEWIERLDPRPTGTFEVTLRVTSESSRRIRIKALDEEAAARLLTLVFESSH